jgi:SAM-dependent methyltransferase
MVTGPTCANCDAGTLAPLDQQVDLQDVLRRWEMAIGIQFRPEVWDSYRDVAGPLILHGCPACKFSVFLPLVTGTDIFYAQISANEYYVADKWEFRRALADLRAPEMRKVLDVGCGRGAFLERLRAGGKFEAAGVESNPAAREAARAAGHVAYGTAAEAGDSAPYDAACMFQVIEHLDDPFVAFDEIRRLVRPNGLIVVTMPNAVGPIRHFSDALTEIPPHHVTRWSETTVRTLAQRHEVTVVRMRFEPLPDYLWDSYVPVILERDFGSPRIGRWLNRSGTTRRLIKLFRWVGLRNLPVTGHTLYALLRNEREGDRRRAIDR